MPRLSRIPGPALAAALCSLFTTPALAKVDLGLGVIGAAGGNFLDKADRQPTDPDIYPGFAGPTYGGGFFVDIRFIEVLGVEVDAIRSTDRGSGTVKFNGFDFDMTLGQSAWHVPVLVKLTLGAPVVAPLFFVGPEFVFPGDPEMDVEGPSGFVVPPDLFRGAASNYTMVTFGGGLEIKLPLPALDLRIPIAARFSYGPGVPADFDERVKLGGTVAQPNVTYDSEWKYAVGLTAGVGLWF